MKSGPESEKYQEVPNARLPASFFLIQKKNKNKNNLTEGLVSTEPNPLCFGLCFS